MTRFTNQVARLVRRVRDLLFFCAHFGHRAVARTIRQCRLTARRLSIAVVFLLVCLFAMHLAGQERDSDGAKPGRDADPRVAVSSASTSAKASSLPMVPDPSQVGGEPDGVVQVANLVYAGVKSSQCFSDHFLVTAEKESAISTSRRFHAVKLGSDELFNFPMVIMTGEGDFQLTDGERQNLRQFVERGGFLLASSGCSSREWDRSFRQEMAGIFPDTSLEPLGTEHSVFHTVYDITELQAKHGEPRPLEGISLSGRLGVLYSQDGLNDTAHTQGCCCCGGNEITNAVQVNVNILAYALIY